ncbi:Epidermal growth factor-binding protein type B [Coemansia sp. RSA 2320]|nr:Epidermal growth factor-binding protein type B [Coemansia sp. RSA 2320]
MSFAQQKPIIGGSAVQPHEFPFAVYLSIETQPSWHAVCGGTLISDRHIVTAGHCLIHAPSAQAIKVGYGHAHVKQQTHARVKRLQVHPQFNPRTLFNDIAVIELDTPIRQTRTVHRVPVFFGSVEPGHVVTTVGWGITSNAPGSHTVPAMNKVDLTVASPKSCRTVDESFQSSNGPFVCTGTQPGGRDECSGDSGSPALVTVQAGKPLGSRDLALLRKFINRAKSQHSSSASSSIARHWRRPKAQAYSSPLAVDFLDMRLAALTSYGDNSHHDVHPPCGDPNGFGFSTHVAFYADFITNATGLPRSELEAPLRLDRLADVRSSGASASNTAASVNHMLALLVLVVTFLVGR